VIKIVLKYTPITRTNRPPDAPDDAQSGHFVAPGELFVFFQKGELDDNGFPSSEAAG
jgi:hypothetical protein